jgi:hypothetical protein
MTHTKDEALKLAIQSLESCSGVPHWPAICATIVTIKQALAAPVQPVAWFKHGPYEDGEPLSVVFENPHDDVCYSPLGFIESPTIKPAPDLQAELEATNRQVEILSDALAESRRELAALTAVQEPVAWTLLLVGAHNGLVGKAGEKFLGHPEHYQRVDVYTTPPTKEFTCSTGLYHYKALPDALTSADIQEHIEYVAGWNDYRAAMMEMMK